jgi:hypothetical protein
VPFELRYHLDVKSVNIPPLDARPKARIKNAIETIYPSLQIPHSLPAEGQAHSEFRISRFSLSPCLRNGP